MKHFFLTLALVQLSIICLAQKDTCDIFAKDVDKFTNDVTIHSDYRDTYASVTKVIAKNKSTYYLSLTAYGFGDPQTNGKGVVVLLTNNKKLVWPNEKVKVSVDRDHYAYSCFIRLTVEQISTLQKNRVTDWRLVSYDNTINEEDGKQLQKAFICITSAQ